MCGEAKEAEQSANDVGDDDGVLDLMDMIIPEEQEEQIKKNLMVNDEKSLIIHN